MSVRGVYRFSSLVKQNKKAKICFVIYIAGKKKLLFYIYAVIVKQNFYKRATNYYSHVSVSEAARAPAHENSNERAKAELITLLSSKGLQIIASVTCEKLEIERKDELMVLSQRDIDGLQLKDWQQIRLSECIQLIKSHHGRQAREVTRPLSAVTKQICRLIRVGKASGRSCRFPGAHGRHRT